MLQSLKELLVHASQCDSPRCPFLNCPRTKALFLHESQCKRHQSGGCLHCKKIWCLLRYHAWTCKTRDCNVPHCRRMRELMTRRLHHRINSRLRATLMETRPQATKSHKAIPNLDDMFNVKLDGGKITTTGREGAYKTSREANNDVLQDNVPRKTQTSTSTSDSSGTEPKRNDATSAVENIAGNIVNEVSKIKGLDREEVFKACEWLIENKNKFYILKNLTPQDKKAYLLSRMYCQIVY